MSNTAGNRMGGAYLVKLPEFEGPFELLYHLIEKEEVDIRDIPISRITEQYLDYLVEMRELNLEIAAEFLVMAATLIRIKARTLIPTPPKQDEAEDEGDDPREELTKRLIVYARYRAAATRLRQLATEWRCCFAKGFREEWPLIRKKVYLSPAGEATRDDLRNAYTGLLKARRDKDRTVEFERTEMDLAERMAFLLSSFARKRVLRFSSLTQKAGRNPRRVVADFMAMLELVRRKTLVVSQPEPFGEIFMRLFKPVDGEPVLALRESAASAEPPGE